LSAQQEKISVPVAQGERYALVVLALLCFVYVLNFLDRQLLSILAKPIQDELGVTDGQLGRLGGLYFALFYCILGVPVAWLADRSNRVRVLTFACAVWSAATVACGMAQNYAQLTIARTSVGIGEAGGVPGAMSDYFRPTHPEHSLQMAFYTLVPFYVIAIVLHFVLARRLER
jgi:predicted MFS family arabinose efflux permease